MKRLASHLPIVALALACAAVGFLLARGTLDFGSQPLAVEQATVLAQPRLLPEFALLDHRGRPAARADLEDQWQLVFFGFTHCPDVCPITLQALAQVRAQLQADGQTVPGVVFVSVDPERDDPATVAEYLGYFDDEYLGLTGRTREDVLRLTGEMGVAVRIGEPDGEGHYDVDHTPALFLLNPRAELAAVFTGGSQFPVLHEVGPLVRDLRQIMSARR